MNEYHKIQSIYKRDEKGKFIVGQWSLPEFEYLQYCNWEWTEKVDGTNIRVMWSNDIIKFGGKTDNAQIPVKLFDKLNERFPVGSFKDKPDMCLYGEGYGVKIQKGGGNYIKDGVDFVLFDVKVGHWWLKREDVNAIADEMGIGRVPTVFRGTIHEAISVVKAGFQSKWGDFIAEGLVGRPAVDLFARNGDRIITKIKHVDWK